MIVRATMLVSSPSAVPRLPPAMRRAIDFDHEPLGGREQLDAGALVGTEATPTLVLRRAASSSAVPATSRLCSVSR